MRFVTVKEVVHIHDALIAGGGPGNEKGILNEGMVDAAVYRHKYGPFGSGSPDLSERASFLLRMAQDHPFVEANKRTAFEVTDFFLRHNGFEFNPDEMEAIEFMLRLGGEHLGRRPEYGREDPVQLSEIRDWIMRNMGKI